MVYHNDDDDDDDDDEIKLQCLSVCLSVCAQTLTAIDLLAATLHTPTDPYTGIKHSAHFYELFEQILSQPGVCLLYLIPDNCMLLLLLITVDDAVYVWR